jgi:hypothetical protein
MNVVAEVSATSRNNIQEFSFWQEKNEDVKRFNVTHGFSGVRNQNTFHRMKERQAILFQSRGAPATL